MTDLDKLNSIITKCQWLRKSTNATPNEIWLSDLVEALAIQLMEHHRDHARDRALAGKIPSCWLTPQDIDPPRPPVEKSPHWFGLTDKLGRKRA